MTSAYLTLADAVEIVPVSQITLRRAIKAGDLAAFKVGSRVLVRPDDLHEWVESRPAQADPPMPKPERVREGSGSLLDQALQRREAA